MKIYKNIIRYILTTGICLIGTISCANTLSAVDVYQNGNSGKILLSASQIPVVKKINVSEDEITLKLSNTDISSNLTSVAGGSENISVMQDGTSTFVTISGNNVSDYKILNASDNSVIPTSSDNNSAIFLSALLFVLSLGFMSAGKKQRVSVNKKIKTVSSDVRTEAEKDMLKDLKTLRSKIQAANTSSIHGNPVLRFANNSVNPAMSVPESLKSTVPFGRKSTYLKTAVNS